MGRGSGVHSVSSVGRVGRLVPFSQDGITMDSSTAEKIVNGKNAKTECDFDALSRIQLLSYRNCGK